MAAFTFFSPSRFSTYRCRLTHDGVPAPGTHATGSPTAFGGLADGHYIFEVAGTDERGNADATPAARSFTVASSGPVGLDRLRIRPRRRRAAIVAFTFSSPSRAPPSSAGCRPRSDAGRGWEECSGSAGYAGLADGTMELRGAGQGTRNA